MLFSAYAIGGMLNSLYTYAFGPSIAMYLSESNASKETKITYLSVFSLVVLALLVVILPDMFSAISQQYSFFLRAIGFSLIGGGIMIIAQRKRIHILQISKDSVFVPDVMANILIISSAPFIFYLFGREYLSMLFLWNADPLRAADRGPGTDLRAAHGSDVGAEPADPVRA